MIHLDLSENRFCMLCVKERTSVCIKMAYLNDLPVCSSLTGTLPSVTSTTLLLSHFSVAANQIVGAIPSSFTNLGKLLVVDVASNQVRSNHRVCVHQYPRV